MEPNQGRAALPAHWIEVDQTIGPGQAYAQQHGHQAGGHRPAHRRVVAHQDHCQHCQPHHRLGVGAQQEAQGDVAQGNASQGGEQGCARQPALQAVADEGTGAFDQPRTQAGDQPSSPREGYRCGWIQALAQGRQLHRQHHQKHIGEQAHRVDPVGEGGAVVAPLALVELKGLAGVSQVAHHQADASGRQDRAEDQAVGIAEYAAAKGHDQQDLDQVVEPEAEEAIEVTGGPPAWFGHGGGGRCGEVQPP